MSSCAQCGTSTGTHWPNCSHYVGPAPQRAEAFGVDKAGPALDGEVTYTLVELYVDQFSADRAAKKLSESGGVYHRIRRLSVADLVKLIQFELLSA